VSKKDELALQSKGQKPLREEIHHYIIQYEKALNISKKSVYNKLLEFCKAEGYVAPSLRIFLKMVAQYEDDKKTLRARRPK